MNREYHKWYSRELYRDMEMLVYGHAGYPVLVFPTSMGRFFEYEDRGMIGAVWDKIEAGHLRFYCIDSIDTESWYNRGTHPKWRVVRHSQYENYVRSEVVPYINWRSGTDALTVTGASFGGYHAINFALRNPFHVTYCVSMAGAFDIHQFLDGYYDDNCYFHCPVDYVPNLHDHYVLERLRHGTRLVLTAGEWDICLGENLRMSGILNSKGIPHQLDVWGDQTMHDWPWWQRMARKFF